MMDQNEMKESEQYLQELTQKNGEGLEGMELKIFTNLMKIRDEVIKGQEQLQQMQQQLTALSEQLKRKSGQLDGYAMLLWQEERDRREAKTPAPTEVPKPVSKPLGMKPAGQLLTE